MRFSGPEQRKGNNIFRFFKIYVVGEEENLPETIKCEARLVKSDKKNLSANIAIVNSRDKVLSRMKKERDESKSRKEQTSEELSAKISEVKSEMEGLKAEVRAEMKELGTKMDAILSAFAKSVE